VLILGGGLRGQRLATDLIGAGHAVRVLCSDRAEPVAGAERFAGDPNRLGTMRGALEGVAIACWLFRAEHAERLPAFLSSAIDSTLRGFLYEAPPAQAARVREIAARNAIPVQALSGDRDNPDLWLADVRARLSLFL
jgi:hypothetical protein